MPSNAELIADIDALSNELGQTVNVTGLKNDQLAKLLSGLRDEKAARASAQSAPDAGAPAPDAQAAAAALEALMAPVAQALAVEAKPPYYVAPGKAVTSKIGILSGDTADEVKAEYFEGGAETLQTLVDTDYVIES